jgi:Domain of Unknown Function (DUF1206)
MTSANASASAKRTGAKASAKRTGAKADQGAQRATHSKTVEWLTRFGFICYGVLHALIAYLALQIAFGGAGQEGDQSGAFKKLAEQPFGKVVLIVMVIGLAGLAIWQALLAAVGHRNQHGKALIAERVASGGRAVVYVALAVTAAKVVAGAPASSAGSQQHATQGVMAKPAGVWLVGLAGVVVLAVGIGMIWYGLTHKFEDKLHTARMSRSIRQAVRRLGQVGYPAKGVAYGIVGVLLLDAAITNNPQESRGLDAALRSVADKPFGVVALVVIAIGFLAYGVFCLFQSRYRKVGT